MLHFIGLTIPADNEIENLLTDEFKDTHVKFTKCNNLFCLYYDNALYNSSTFKPDDNQKISLTPNQLQHFINTLKRVKSDKLYNSYNDNFGVKHIAVEKEKLVFRSKK
jgi:hypothetical protein